MGVYGSSIREYSGSEREKEGDSIFHARSFVIKTFLEYKISHSPFMWLNKFNLTVTCVCVCARRRERAEREKKNCAGILYIDQMNKELKPFSQQTFFSLSLSLFLSIESFDNATIKVNDLYSLYCSHTFPFTLPTCNLHWIQRHSIPFPYFSLAVTKCFSEKFVGRNMNMKVDMISYSGPNLNSKESSSSSNITLSLPIIDIIICGQHITIA